MNAYRTLVRLTLARVALLAALTANGGVQTGKTVRVGLTRLPARQ